MKITIPNPCRENWEDMTLKDQDRFCSVCHKCVYDFTEKSDEEIYTLMNGKKDICAKIELVTAKNQKHNFGRNLIKSLKTNSHRYQFFFPVISLLIMIIGCSEKKNNLPIIGEAKFSDENFESKESGIVLGKMEIIEEDSTTHFLQNLDQVIPKKDTAENHQ